MMEERYHVTIQNLFYLDMSNVNKNITVGEKLISPPMYVPRDAGINAPHCCNTVRTCMLSSPHSLHESDDIYYQ